MVKRTSFPARTSNYHRGRLGGIRVIVVHTGETGEGSTAAEGMGSWFADQRARASAHKGADPDSICTYVRDADTAWAAPGANADGLQLELAGRAGQTSGEWDDAASRAILANGATVVREWCTQHAIPARWLTDAQLRDGVTRGLATHAQVSRVFKLSNHWDPGTNFPAARFLALVTGAPAPTVPLPEIQYFYEPTGTMTVKAIQKVVGVTADGLYGAATKAAVATYQAKLGVSADGLWGPATEAAHKGATVAPKKTPLLVVDGVLGVATYKALQRAIGATPDGIFGPASRRALQRHLKVTPDGVVGARTIRALQRRVGATQDGEWGRATTRALQLALNKGAF